MGCKYYRCGLCRDYCRAKRWEEKVTFAHAKEYCKSSHDHTKCPTYREVSGGFFHSGFFGW